MQDSEEPDEAPRWAWVRSVKQILYKNMQVSVMSDDSVMISDGEVCLHTTAEQKQIYTFPFVLVPWFKIE